MLATRRITAPTGYPVTLAEAKAQLDVASGDRDTLITALIASATERLDGWSGILGRCLVTQVWEDRYEAFASEHRLALGPVQSIVSITYDDAAGIEQTASPSLYQLIDDTLYLRPGQSWPAIGNTIGPVRIRYVAGYGAAEAVPEPIKHAILLMVGRGYALARDVGLQRIDIPGVVTKTFAAIGDTSSSIGATVDALIAPYRMVGVGA